jgi:hypothetical protein
MAKRPDQYRTGPLRELEWSGFWRATAEEPEMTGEEWNEKWTAFRKWLSQKYNLEPVPVRTRQCFVWDDYSDPERTLVLQVQDMRIFNIAFLQYVQEWLQRDALHWRVAIPTDGRQANLIYIYPSTIRVNPQAEADLKSFIEDIKPAFEESNRRSRREVGLEW